MCQDNLFNALGVYLCFSLHKQSFLVFGSHYFEGGRSEVCTAPAWASVLQVDFGTGLKGVGLGEGVCEWSGRKGQGQEKQDIPNHLQRCGNGLLSEGTDMCLREECRKCECV